MTNEEIQAILTHAPQAALDATMSVTRCVGEFCVTHEGPARSLLVLGLIDAEAFLPRTIVSNVTVSGPVGRQQ